jgi:hypothetical protein
LKNERVVRYILGFRAVEGLDTVFWSAKAKLLHSTTRILIIKSVKLLITPS